MTPFVRAKLARRWAAVAALAILAVAGLEGFALSQGINGNLLTAAFSVITALGGAAVARARK